MIYWVIGIAGMIGALLRYYVGLWLPTSELGGFPVGTLLVNFLGCFLLSWFSVKSTELKMIPSWVQISFTTGLIGSFTTFSTFSIEVIQMIDADSWGMALFYIILSLWGGFALAWCGYQVATRSKKEGESIDHS